MEISEDLFLNGLFKVKQPVSGHRSGMDAMLLAAFSNAKEGASLIDLGSGVGVAGFCVLAKTTLSNLTLVEIQPELAILASENAELNNFKNVTILNQSIENRAALPINTFDFAICNPPFNPSSLQASPIKALAHSSDDVEAWVKAAAHCLKAKGELALIDRPERLPQILIALEKAFGGIEIQPVFTKDNYAKRILIRAVMGSKKPLTLLAALKF